MTGEQNEISKFIRKGLEIQKEGRVDEFEPVDIPLQQALIIGDAFSADHDIVVDKGKTTLSPRDSMIRVKITKFKR